MGEDIIARMMYNEHLQINQEVTVSELALELIFDGVCLCRYQTVEWFWTPLGQQYGMQLISLIALG